MREMKTTTVVVAVLLVLAFVVSGPAEAFIGLSIPIIHEKERRVEGNVANLPDIALFMPDGRPLGFQREVGAEVRLIARVVPGQYFGDRVEGLPFKVGFTIINLPNPKSHQVYFGFPSLEEFIEYSRMLKIPKAYRGKRIEQEYREFVGKMHEGMPEIGVWIPADYEGAGRWGAVGNTNMFPIGQRIFLMCKVEGKFNRKDTTLLILFHFGSWKKGQLVEPISVVCREAPEEWREMSLNDIPRWDFLRPNRMNRAVLEGFEPSFTIAPDPEQPQVVTHTIPGQKQVATDYQVDVQPGQAQAQATAQPGKFAKPGASGPTPTQVQAQAQQQQTAQVQEFTQSGRSEQAKQFQFATRSTDGELPANSPINQYRIRPGQEFLVRAADPQGEVAVTFVSPWGESSYKWPHSFKASNLMAISARTSLEDDGLWPGEHQITLRHGNTDTIITLVVEGGRTGG